MSQEKIILTTVTFLSPLEDDSAGMVIRLGEDSSRSEASDGELKPRKSPPVIGKRLPRNPIEWDET